MDKVKEIAGILDGLEYGQEPSKVIIDKAKSSGIVIVFGASDDLMEFRGAVDEEIGCWGGGYAYFTSQGMVENLCSDHCPYAERAMENATPIEALWRAEGDCSWTYKTDIPHETFEVLEYDEPYCRGIVFKLSDCIKGGDAAK